mgnify:CR=1 FL=1
MKNIILTCTAILLTTMLEAQSFNIGQTTITFIDPARNNRNIPTEVFYPANTSGINVPVAEGNFPVLSFGHGFLMNYDAYSVYWDDLVPKGYIVALPKTETGFSPNHLDFALDLAFVIQALKAEGFNQASMFYQKVAEESSILGHSMGGGCAYLGVASDTTISSVVSFAASVGTNPPALPVAAGLTLPSLIFSGQNDSVTPYYSNQLPLYQALLSDCKTYISINGGAHCYFGNQNQICDLGELLSGSNPTISREEQHDVVFTFLSPWLDFILKGDNNAFGLFEDSLYTSSRITYLHDCLTTSAPATGLQNNVLVSPNPFSELLSITIRDHQLYKSMQISIFDCWGKVVFKQNNLTQNEISINLQSQPGGLYLVRLSNENGEFTRKVMKLGER